MGTKKDLAYIYQISCPIKKKPVYIGKTVNPKLRIRSHKYLMKRSACGHDKNSLYPYMARIIDIGLDPIFKVIFVCNRVDVRNLEEDIIVNMVNNGHELFNKIKAMPKNTVKRFKKPVIQPKLEAIK